MRAYGDVLASTQLRSTKNMETMASFFGLTEVARQKVIRMSQLMNACINKEQ